MRYIFWINFSLAVFFGFINLILWVVLFLYWQNIGAVRTSVEEFNSTLIAELFLFAFASLTGLVAWGAHNNKKWIWLPEILAVLVAVAVGFYLRSFV